MDGVLSHHLEKLVGFVTVAKEKSFSRAASRLNVSQPTLSHSIKVLEAALGTQVFVRTSRGIRLTPAGRCLLEFGERLLAETNAVESRIRQPDGLLDANTVDIGTKAPYAVHLWPDYLDGLYAGFPSLKLRLHVDRSNAELLKQLLDRKLHMVMIPEPAPSELVRAYEIFRDSYAFYLAPKLKVPSGRVKELSSLPLILFRAALSAGNRTLEQRFRKHQLALDRVRDVDSFEAARAMAIQGLGLVVLPSCIGEADVKRGSLARATVGGVPEDFFPVMKVCACVHIEDVKHPLLKAIIRHLKIKSRDGIQRSV